MTDAQSMIEVHSKVSDTTYNAEYGTNQPHLKRDTRAKCKKNVCHTHAPAKIKFCTYLRVLSESVAE